MSKQFFRSCAFGIGLLAVPSSPCWAQNVEPLVSAWQGHLSIRQSLKDKNTINEPAFVALNMPDEGPNTNIVAFAMEAKLLSDLKNPRFNLKASTQFNQNSAAGARQNVFQGGGGIEWRTGPAGAESAGDSFRFVRMKGNTLYKRNGEKHTGSFAAQVYGTWEQNRPDEESSSIPIGCRQLEFTPQGGVEFERVLSAPSGDPEGRVTRVLGSAKFNWYPIAAHPKRLVFSADLAYRRDVQTDFDGDRDHPYLQLSAAFGLDPHGIFNIALDRVMGEDPTQDFTGPDFTRLVFKVQFTRPQKRSILRARARARALAAPHII